MDKEVVVYTHTYTHTGVLFISKKNEIIQFCNHMDGHRDYHTK